MIHYVITDSKVLDRFLKYEGVSITLDTPSFSIFKLRYLFCSQFKIFCSESKIKDIMF